MGRVTCTQCGMDEVGMRAGLVVGGLRNCTHCGTSYRVTEIRNVTSRGTGRPSPRPAAQAKPTPPRASVKKAAPQRARATAKALSTPSAKKKAH